MFINTIKSLLSKHIGKLALMNAILAVVAFLKDIAFATYFGTTKTADLLSLAYFLPDMIGNNLIGSALAVACVPIFSSLVVRKQWLLLQCTLRKITLHIIGMSIVCLLVLLFFIKSIYHWLGQGLIPTDLQSLYVLVVLLLPALVFFSVVPIFTSVLQAFEKFVSSAWIPIVFNGLFLFFVLILLVFNTNRETGGIVIAGGILLSACGMLVSTAGFLYVLLKENRKSIKHTFQIFKGTFFARKSTDLFDSIEIREIYRVFIPYFIILLSTQMIYGVERQIASMMSTGTIAALNYAFRIAQFPNWVFVSAITTVILPRLVKVQVRGDEKKFRSLFYKAIQGLLLVAVPISLCICLLRHPLLKLLFMHGAFNQQSIFITSAILKGYSLSIIGQSLSALFLRYFIVIKQLYVPMCISICSSFFNIYFDYHWRYYFQIAVFGYGAASASLVNVLGLLGYFLYVQKNSMNTFYRQVIK